MSLSPSTLSSSEAGGVGGAGPQPPQLPETTRLLAMMESSISPPDPGLFSNGDMADAIDWDSPCSEMNIMPVRRIDMSEEGSASEVVKARMEGVPVVITGHKAWATWAHPWLESSNPGPVDLSKNEYKLNVEAMVQDIGDELVPVIRKDYSESAPIHGNIQAKTFLENVRSGKERTSDEWRSVDTAHLILCCSPCDQLVTISNTVNNSSARRRCGASPTTCTCTSGSSR